MTGSRHLAAAFALAALLACCGCDDFAWWDYRDDPYLADMSGKGKQEVLRNVNSMNHDQRQAALRIIAHQAGTARRKGRAAEAERLDAIIIRRYHVEKEQEVRACIVRICAPMTGMGGAPMAAFLRERIAAGEFPGYAALSLVAVDPKGAVVDLEPLTRHPAPEVRLQAAIALSVLGDQRGYEAVARVWRGMTPPSWPDRIAGAPLAVARSNLELRAIRGFGRPLQ